MILIIDNYDSFVFNLARYFVELDEQVKVVRNDEVLPEQIKAKAVVISGFRRGGTGRARLRRAPGAPSRRLPSGPPSDRGECGRRASP